MTSSFEKELVMNINDQFFDFAAEVGLTKHLGNVDATDRLAELCQINRESYVLDVGCGTGATAAYLADVYGCRVMGVDILPRMIDRARELAARKGVSDLTDFRVGDAQDLPSPDDQFDAVITESVTAFPADKAKAVSEYMRVLKPGGYLGLNESTWLKTPPPPEVIAWASQEVGATVSPLTKDQWAGLLEKTGFRELVVEIQEIDVKDEAKGILARYGFSGMIRILGRTFKLYFGNKNYRDFVKGVSQSGITPENLTEYFGYGIYVGKK
jgi:ubiquinone/menaquinone biosynthesis C-methylase UbiE